MRSPRQLHRVFLLALLFGAVTARAQTPVVTTHSDAAPSELAEPINTQLAAGGQRVAVGSKALTFWWVKTLPLRAGSSEVGWSAIDEGTLVGAVTLSSNYTDMRGRVVKPGVYTLRYGVQPADGNHLGASPNPEFLLLSPAASDTSAAPLGHEGTIKISKLSIGLSHPAVWGLDPPVASGAPLSLKKNDAGMTAVIFDLPVSRDGKDAGRLKFGLILIGEIQA